MRLPSRTRSAREYKALPKGVRKRLKPRIDRLADQPRPQGVKALQGDLLRLRVGDYRVIYRVEDERLVVLVIRVGHRGKVYRRR